MKYTILGILLLLSIVNGYSQESEDDLKFYICKDQRTEIYEGEFLNFCYCIENTSNQEAQIDISTRAYIKNIKDENEKELFYNSPNKFFDGPEPRDLTYHIVKPMPSGYKSCNFITP